ncbi:hypothetical protein WJT74_09110 [Sphingomicrobium sp. XHP0239]|uniref:hypothetical protein n=1 Tax=Sphingomicrobium maritimum TaxID=3133972 RepID=UPI0031CCA3CC
MKTMLALGGFAIAGGAAAVAGAEDATAQPRPIGEIVVFGEDPCPRSTDDNVVVCARKPESERYRIPEEFRQNGSRQQNQSWAANARYLETVNSTGIRRCSPVGPEGALGCLSELIENNRAEREEFEEEEVFVAE